MVGGHHNYRRGDFGPLCAPVVFARRGIGFTALRGDAIPVAAAGVDASITYQRVRVKKKLGSTSSTTPKK